MGLADIKPVFFCLLPATPIGFKCLVFHLKVIFVDTISYSGPDLNWVEGFPENSGLQISKIEIEVNEQIFVHRKSCVQLAYEPATKP